MPNVLQKFRDEHARVHELLAMFDHELTGLRDPSADPDYQLLHDIARYLVHYLHVVHHHNEELMLELVAARAPELKRLIGRVRDQHEDIAALSEHLLLLLDGVCAGHLVPRDELLRDAERLLIAQSANIAFEHDSIMSRSERRLNERDWQAVADAYHAQPQTHYDEKLHAEFRRLWDEIRDAYGRCENVLN